MRITDLLANQGYIIINKQIAKEYGLHEAIILGELAQEYNYFDDRDMLEDGWFYSTIENVEEATTLSAHQQRTALKHLEEEGFIEVQRRGVPAKRYIRLDVEELSNKMLKNLTTGSKKIKELDVKKFNGNNNKEIIINNNNNNINSAVEEIISYLNSKAGTRYNPKTKQTVQHIRARLNEGYTVDDFKAVIDKKCDDWMGTEWEAYLRPNTLFAGKFESYLNSPVKKKKTNNGYELPYDMDAGLFNNKKGDNSGYSEY